MFSNAELLFGEGAKVAVHISWISAWRNIICFPPSTLSSVFINIPKPLAFKICKSQNEKIPYTTHSIATTWEKQSRKINRNEIFQRNLLFWFSIDCQKSLFAFPPMGRFSYVNEFPTDNRKEKGILRWTSCWNGPNRNSHTNIFCIKTLMENFFYVPK